MYIILYISVYYAYICHRLNYIHNGELLGVGISTLPGCKIRDQKRSVIADLETLKDKGITDIFVFSTSSELVG